MITATEQQLLFDLYKDTHPELTDSDELNEAYAIDHGLEFNDGSVVFYDEDENCWLLDTGKKIIHIDL